MTSNQILITSIVMGAIMFCLTACSLIPQIFALKRTRNTSGISLASYIIISVDNIFWIIWTFGFYFNSMLMYKEPMTRIYQISLLMLILGYLFGSCLAIYILIIKFRHTQLAKANKVTELQLAKILIDNDKNKYFSNKHWHNFERYLLPTLAILISLGIAFTAVSLLYVFAYITPVVNSKEWVWVIVVSLIASVIWEASAWPQLVKSIKGKNTTGLSLFWAIFNCINTIATFVHDLTLAFISGGFSYDILFILIFSAMIPNTGVMICKVRNVIKAKKAGMTELEYTKKVLIPSLKKNKKIKSK